MKKISTKLWTYSILFLLRAIMFNVALAFAITALVYVGDGMTTWAIIAIASAGTWFALNVINHLIWSTMSKNERGLYFGIRRYGPEVVKVTKAEMKRRTGQQDVLEVLRDTDASLEIQMIINGTATLVNVLVGTKWIHHARKFNKNLDVFDFEVVDHE